uniref:Putative scp-like extracellular protein n=2 Tax=Culex tarsalis TaxID=7177 RepID=A0A1Q3EVW1_CULTA
MRSKAPMGPSIKIILAKIMVTLVLLLVETKCCASTSSSRPAKTDLDDPPNHRPAQTDFYCRKDACPGGVANVGCHCSAGAYGTGCVGKAARRISLDQHLRDVILREHNVKRNLIACGSIEPFEPAARMAEVTWDAELEHLAWCNVRQCAYGHDHCRSTRAFHFAGQNIAQRTACVAVGAGAVPPAMKPDETIHKSIGSWFQEHGNATLGMIDRFPANVTSGPIGHFTVMVNEKVRRVGCALIAYKQQQQQHRQKDSQNHNRKICLVHYLVCNYSHTNFVRQKTYTKSPEPVQNCSLYSAEYSCLCSSHEPLLATGGGGGGDGTY